MGGFVLIEVCDANPACVSDLFELETEYPAVSVLETPCLSECELCALQPYVFVNGDIVAGDDVPSLLTQVRASTEEAIRLYNTEI
ncbi:DUF1450 domain-containing protein [Alicyclobacillus shizuokensis]|uniref:DUF1450 domain-containing protein n=1 Tax=Alicyclobacillus shizuokensis TaxID=392014 RepID=UPI00082EE6A7|nr:DUF1450 domain-containing protein [Alicyclobacillus shizuokensis]MCL6625029.1 YuzB family protein [Alicyclobacillus shizuokensis]